MMLLQRSATFELVRIMLERFNCSAPRIVLICDKFSCKRMELSEKAQKANNVWWRLSGLLGDQNRPMMYILLQAAFTVATLALTVPIFFSYRLHVIFQILKVSATTWNGGSFLLEVMPRQVVQKEKKKLEMKPITVQPDQPEAEPLTNGDHSDYTW